MPMRYSGLIPGADERIDLSDGLVHTLDSTKYDPASHSLGSAVVAILIPVGGNISIRSVGSDPSATLGLPFKENQAIKICSHQVIKKLRVIKTSGTSVYLNVEYYHL